MGQIYLIKNLINEKVYIGMTTRKFEDRYGMQGIKSVYTRHKQRNYSHLARAIRKYGFHCWSINILEDHIDDVEELKELEKYYIAKYKSSNSKFGYNKTKGGDTFSKVTMRAVICINTQEVFESAAKAAKVYNITNSTIGLACKGKNKTAAGMQWAYYIPGKEYVLQDVEQLEKKVICINTMEVFNSISDAARAYNTHVTSIGSVCMKKRITAAGMQWAYYQEGKEYKLKDIPKPVRRKPRKVICIDGGKVFDSIIDASEYYDVSYDSINAACRGDLKISGGLQWAYYQEGKEYKLKDLTTTEKKVICIDDGTVFDSITLASEAYSIDHSSISKVCRGKNKTAGGYQWAYYQEGKEYKLKDIPKPVRRKPRKVICINTGEIFESATQAAKEKGMYSSEAIMRVCRGERKTSGGYHWSWYT